MPPDQLFDQPGRCSIQGRERLVGHAQRGRLPYREPRELGPPSLALRQFLGKIVLTAQTEDLEGTVNLFFIDAQACQGASDSEVLCGRELVLQGAGVTDENQLLRVFLPQPPYVAALPAHLAAVRQQQAAQNTQQAGLAAAVRPGDAQQLAAIERERQAAEKPSPAPLAIEGRRLEPGHLSCDGRYGVPLIISSPAGPSPATTPPRPRFYLTRLPPPPVVPAYL